MIRYLSTFWLCLCTVGIWTSAEKLSANYIVNWKTGGGNVTFNIQARTVGWVGLGFNTRGSMKGADIVVAGVKSGKGFAYDLHGVANDLPPADSKQDYKVLKASQNGTHTLLSIRRRLNTGDSEDFKLSAGSSVVVLWAIGDDPPQNIYNFHYHSSRGYKTLTF